MNIIKEETAGSRIKRRTGIISSEARMTSSVVVSTYFQRRSQVENKEIPGVPGGIFYMWIDYHIKSSPCVIRSAVSVEGCLY